MRFWKVQFIERFWKVQFIEHGYLVYYSEGSDITVARFIERKVILISTLANSFRSINRRLFGE